MPLPPKSSKTSNLPSKNSKPSPTTSPKPQGPKREACDGPVPGLDRRMLRALEVYTLRHALQRCRGRPYV